MMAFTKDAEHGDEGQEAVQIEHSSQAGWDEAAWDVFAGAHPAGHPLQLHAWGRLKREFGWEDARLGLSEGGKLIAGAQVLFRRLPHLGFLPARLAYVPKGPLVDWQDESLVRRLCADLWQFCRHRGAVALKIEPEIADGDAIAHVLQQMGFRPGRTVQPRMTVWIDLRADEETILARMHQKWRYNVRLAGRKGVVVREGRAEDLPVFGALMQATGQRNTFGVHEPAYYRRFWELFAPQGSAALLLAEHEGEPLAALMAARLADRAYYLYGASGNDDRNLMPNHLLQWETMRWARAHGCTAYDLWGIPDEAGIDPEAPIPDSASGLWGVWRFKRGFGGQVVRYTGAWDRLAAPMLAGLAGAFMR